MFQTPRGVLPPSQGPELPEAPKLTVLYTFTNKPNRCYWSSGSSSETKIIVLSHPQDNLNPLSIYQCFSFTGVFCSRALVGGRAGGSSLEWKSSHSSLSLFLSCVLTHPVGRSGPAGCDGGGGVNSVPPKIFTVMIKRSLPPPHHDHDSYISVKNHSI